MQEQGVCGKLFQQPLPDTSEHHNMTKRLRRWIGEQGRIRTFVAIARDLQVAEATVRQVFGDCIREIESARRILPPRSLPL
ncbi:transposase family protein [Delftia tsuruhatensis]